MPPMGEAKPEEPNVRYGRVTEKLHVAKFPAASVAVAVTIELPRGSALAGGLKVIFAAPHPPLVVSGGKAALPQGMFQGEVGQLTNVKSVVLTVTPSETM